MEYHTKNPGFPGDLQMSDEQLDEVGESDINNFSQITVAMFDYLKCELSLFQTVRLSGHVPVRVSDDTWAVPPCPTDPGHVGLQSPL